MSPRERPVLFSGEMVRAILAGRKTQTRRLVKNASGAFWDHAGWTPSVEHGRIVWRSPGYVFAMPKACPLGQPGDRLWVRETWKSDDYGCDEEWQPPDHECSPHCSQTYVYYAATPRVGLRPKPDRARITYLDESSPLTEWYTSGWRPSIHMPRWASRITLEVTDVRVERLQNISEDDAHAEGCTGHDPEPAGEGGTVYSWPGRSSAPCPRAHFMWLWDSISAKRAPWSSNPWVWCVTFRRLEAP